MPKSLYVLLYTAAMQAAENEPADMTPTSNYGTSNQHLHPLLKYIRLLMSNISGADLSTLLLVSYRVDTEHETHQTPH